MLIIDRGVGPHLNHLFHVLIQNTVYIIHVHCVHCKLCRLNAYKSVPTILEKLQFHLLSHLIPKSAC